MSRHVSFADPPSAASRNNKNNNNSNSGSGGGGVTCPNCGSQDIEQQEASGNSVCIECGVVVEENAIVSEVQFLENAGGSSSMMGQFVSATGANRTRGRYGYSSDSREMTLANARRRIQDVASRLRLGPHFVDAAHRLYKIAVEKNFVRGRRTTHVVAATLYIACRQEKSQHMLIDFSDALQVNVYTLGTCFLKFRRLLGLPLDIIDPALYVYRFAAHLDLNEKANAVSLTALRLVGRMKRDWIVAGRRPAGICAAALLIASRAHGFSRHHQDVTRILKVCGLTVKTRVREFEHTPTARLTLEQFGTTEIDSEADPPIFTKNRIREARLRAIQQNNYQLLTSGALDNPLDGKHAASWRKVGRIYKNQQHHNLLYREIEAQLKKRLKGEQNTEEVVPVDIEQEPASAATATKQQQQHAAADDEDDDNDKKPAAVETSLVPHNDNNTGTNIGFQNNPNETQIVPHVGALATQQNPAMAHMCPKNKHGRVIILPNQATAEELQVSNLPVEARLDLAEWKLCMPDSDIQEIDNLFRTDEEMAEKEAIFNKLNRDYIVQQERREEERRQQEAANADKTQDETMQAEGHARYNKRGRKRKKGNTQTTEEALREAVSTRKISRKINYDAMSAIFDDGGGFNNDVNVEPEGGGIDMFDMM